MHQITADELDVFQSNDPARFPRTFPSGRKRNLLFIDRKDTAVRNGNLVGISSKIFYRIAKSMECFHICRIYSLPKGTTSHPVKRTHRIADALEARWT